MSFIPPIPNRISTTSFNSRDAATLAAAATFQGVGEDVSKYGRVGVAITSDNATDGVLTMEVSHDNVTWGGPTRTVADSRFAQPHMWNIVERYFRIKYVNGTTEATNLAIQVQYSVNADVLLGHQLDETLIDETEAIVVRSVDVGQDPVDNYVNERAQGTAFVTTATVAASATFSSGVISANGYSQVQTEIISDKDGTITISFYSDSAGTDLVRSLVIPYTAANGYQFFAAPAFVDFIKYEFTNTEVADTTDFYFTTKFKVTAVSPQLLTADAFIAPSMVTTLGRNIIVGQTAGGDFLNVPVSGTGRLQTDFPRTAFAELLAAEPTPQFQAQFTYGINPLQFLQFPGNGGAITGSGGMAALNTSTAADGFAIIISNDVVKYNAGQGSLARFSALYTTGVANSEQLAGLGNNLTALAFGYNGADFSILRRTGGQTEMRKLTVSTASTTAENITITLDGVAETTVAVTNSGDTTITAKEIADHNYLSVGTGWATEVAGNEVTFFSIDAASHSGSYSLSSATTAVGSFAQLVAGNTATDEWVAQASWNGDVMDGTGRSGITLDPTKGNVFQIRYEWLGFGRMQYSIQNPNTGDFIEVHAIQYGNVNTVPSLDNPTMPISMSVRNLGNTSDLTVKSASMSGLLEGIDADLGPNFGEDRLFVIGNVTTEEPILTIRGLQPFNSKINQIRNEIISISLTSNLNSASANTTFRVYINATPINGTSYADVETGLSSTQVDKAGADIDLTGAEEVGSFILSATESQIFDLKDLGLKVPPPQTLTITAQPSKGHASNEVGAAINWKELI